MKTMLPLYLMSAMAALATPAYEVHEWGTFTTVSGSDGVLLTGLQREEEHLPYFVHAHAGMENGQEPDAAEMERLTKKYGDNPFGRPTKGFDGSRPLENVTVKMETPVIYFHSPETLHAVVKVGFEGGSISQWYPQRSGGEKPPEPAKAPLSRPATSDWTIDFSKPYHGRIEWSVDVLSPKDSAAQVLFKPYDTLSWLRARVPGTNVVKTSGGETEGYLFYRGIGNFQPGLKTTVGSDETLHLENNTGGKIPYLIAFEQSGGEMRWKEWTGGMEAGAKVDLTEKGFSGSATGFSQELYQSVSKGLAACGLTQDESRAMVETWWKSYFAAPGLRVFWVLPRETTDRILPLQITPAPEKIVRVLVGRSEVFRPKTERMWLGMSEATGDQANPWIYLVTGDRFGLPISSRVEKLHKQGVTAASTATAGNNK